MKRALALLLSVIMILSLFGCGKADGAPDAENNVPADGGEMSSSTSEKSDDTQAAPTEASSTQETVSTTSTTTSTTVPTSKKVQSSDTGSSNSAPSKKPAVITTTKAPDPKDYGTKTIVDGAKYTFNVGDTITLVIPDTDRYEHYGVSWYGSGAVRKYSSYNSPQCKITATSAGTSDVGAYVYATTKGGVDVEYNYEVTITVKGSTQSSSNGSGSSGGSTGGSYYPTPPASDHCTHCGNKGTIDCMACIDGWITTSFMDVTQTKPCNSYGCMGGRKDCPFCR